MSDKTDGKEEISEDELDQIIQDMAKDDGQEKSEPVAAAPVKPGDGLVFDAGRPEEREEGGRVYQVTPGRDGEVTLRFGAGDIDWRRVSAGQLVWKTNDPALDRDVRASFEAAS